MSRRRRLLPWLWVVTLAGLSGGQAVAQAPAANSDVSILHFEPLVPATPNVSASFKSSTPGLSFDAFGRRFDLQLEANDRVASPADLASAGSLQLMRGTLSGAPGSWVRLSNRDGVLNGMIWDGSQLLLIEPASAVSKSAASGTVIFRLADTLIGSGAAFCAIPDGVTPASQPVSGQKAFESLVQELQTKTVGMRALGATRRLEISMLGDTLFRAQYATDDQARGEILARMNMVDGIYSAQLGIAIQTPTINVTAGATAALADTTNPNPLLASLNELRKGNQELRARGLTHLFTGRDLDGTTVGVAYRGTLCLTDGGVGLSEVRGRGAAIESLITAHEIGHNFGAVHDGEPVNQGEPDCSATPANQFLMSGSVGPGRNMFSQCSLDTIVPRAQTANCITALPPPDVSVPADLGTLHYGLSREFDVVLPVTNVGGITAVAPQAQLLVPPSLIVIEASVTGGTCTSGAGSINCVLIDLAGGATAQIRLKLRGDTVGSNSFSARVTATGDAQLSNNIGDGTIIIDPDTGLRVELQTPASAATNTSIDSTFTVTNLAPTPSGAVVVDIDLPAGTRANSATLSGAPCTIQTTLVRCSLVSIPSNGSVAGTLSVTSQSAGNLLLRMRVTASFVDAAASNSSAEKTITVSDSGATPARASSGGGGGGGDIGAFMLLALALSATARARVASRSRHLGA